MLFFELLQVAIGNRKELSHTPSTAEWTNLYTLAQKQTLVGIAFRGIEQLPAEQRPPKAMLMQWYMATERIKALNADLDRKALMVANKFLEEGFPGMVLKGQGIAKLYQVSQIDNGQLTMDNGHPDGKFSILNSQFSIKEYRTPGDIDIWLQGERKDILDYVRRHVPDCKPVYHHVDFPVIEGLDIEVHFTPSWMNSPVTNHRLQRFFKGYGLRVKSCEAAVNRDCVAGEGLRVNRTEGTLTSSEATINRSVAAFTHYSEIPSPNSAFNRVYILVHIYRHLFGEGIGLRQLLDYYFVLHQGFTEEERAETMHTLRSLKMERFAAAVMWVLQEVYGMDDRYLLTTPNEREGRFLLSEIMLAGNFGQYDERMQHERGESALHWGLRKVKRNFRFVRSYPSEVLWSPLFKLWHWWWRRRRRFQCG